MVVFLPTLMEGAGGVLQTRIGGVPLVAVVGVAAGLVALWLAVRSRSAAPRGPGGTAIDPLAPSAAEAFGTLQQQQSDLGNALSALGIGQSSILSGQSNILSGQTALGNQGMASYAQEMAGLSYIINPQDPRVQQWEQLSASYGAASTATPAGAAGA